jgi:thioredoxin reductase-like selenoprotein T
MQNKFRQVENYLYETFPELQGQIVGGNYPPPPVAVLLQKILSYVQLLGLAWMIVGGEKLMRLIGYNGSANRPLPQWYWKIQAYAMQISVVIFFVLPQILAKYVNTGAFEIYLDGKEIFSRLKTGNFPTADDLVNPLSASGLSKAS